MLTADEIDPKLHAAVNAELEKHKKALEKEWGENFRLAHFCRLFGDFFLSLYQEFSGSGNETVLADFLSDLHLSSDMRYLILTDEPSFETAFQDHLVYYKQDSSELNFIEEQKS